MAGSAAEYDLVVLGGGPAGYPAAIRASQMGARVCLIEKDTIGGTCINRGCIPTKTMHATAHLMERMESASRLCTGDAAFGPDAESLFEYKDGVVGKLVSGLKQLLKSRNVDVIKGTGTIMGRGEIEVSGMGKVTGKSVLIATGSSEIDVPGMEVDGIGVVGSTELLELGRIPKSLIVIGGGIIGCEFASIFNGLGTKIEIVEMLPRLIATEDMQVSRFLQASFRKRGIGMHLGTKVTSLASEGGAIKAVLDDGSGISAEMALVSVGRRPNVTGIGLENVGIEASPKGIEVNERMETGFEGFYAAGDVVGGWMLAHVATREGIVAAENALGGSRTISYEAIPSTIYTLPEIASVGATEEAAKKLGLKVATGRFPFAANGKAKGLGEEEGFVKWVVDAGEKRLIGLHIIGPQATELIAAGVIAVDRRLTVDEFTSSVFAHPTLSEAVSEAADAVEGRALHILR